MFFEHVLNKMSLEPTRENKVKKIWNNIFKYDAMIGKTCPITPELIYYWGLNLYQSAMHERVNWAVLRCKERTIQTSINHFWMHIFQIHDIIHNIYNEFFLRNQLNYWQVGLYKIHPFNSKFPVWTLHISNEENH